MRFSLVLLLCVSLTGCTTLKAVLGGGSVASANPVTVMDAEKGLTVAHIADNAIGEQLINLAKTGVLHGQAALTAKSWYDKAGDALGVGDAADVAANAQGILDATAKANDAIFQASAIIHPKP